MEIYNKSPHCAEGTSSGSRRCPEAGSRAAANQTVRQQTTSRCSDQLLPTNSDRQTTPAATGQP